MTYNLTLLKGMLVNLVWVCAFGVLIQLVFGVIGNQSLGKSLIVGLIAAAFYSLLLVPVTYLVLSMMCRKTLKSAQSITEYRYVSPWELVERDFHYDNWSRWERVRNVISFTNYCLSARTFTWRVTRFGMLAVADLADRKQVEQP